jgi:hypothetical protein
MYIYIYFYGCSMEDSCKYIPEIYLSKHHHYEGISSSRKYGGRRNVLTDGPSQLDDVSICVYIYLNLNKYIYEYMYAIYIYIYVYIYICRVVETY